MLEPQGTTPENTQASTTPVPVTFDSLDSALAKIAELEAKVKHLESNLDFAKSRVESGHTRANQAESTIDDVRSAIEEALRDSEDPMALYAEFKDAFDLLGVKTEEEVELEITATWIVTVTKPYGHEVDCDDFSASLDLENSELTMDVRWSPDISVSDR